MTNLGGNQSVAIMETGVETAVVTLHGGGKPVETAGATLHGGGKPAEMAVATLRGGSKMVTLPSQATTHTNRNKRREASGAHHTKEAEHQELHQSTETVHHQVRVPLPQEPQPLPTTTTNPDGHHLHYGALNPAVNPLAPRPAAPHQRPGQV